MNESQVKDQRRRACQGIVGVIVDVRRTASTIIEDVSKEAGSAVQDTTILRDRLHQLVSEDLAEYEVLLQRADQRLKELARAEEDVAVLSGRGSQAVVYVTINGVQKAFSRGDSLNFDGIIKRAGKDVFYANKYTVTYRPKSSKVDGTLRPGEVLSLVEDTVFNVADTSNA